MLDRRYTVFGRVVAGMEVADEIARRPKATEDPERPSEPVPIARSSLRTLYRLPLIGEFSF
jgi:cyclophilin family peptidyl-prolyl cis-trans isomerase